MPQELNSENEQAVPGHVASTVGLGVNAALLPCPFCGGEDGYRVHEGSTFRWRNLLCADCGEMVAEARNTANPHEIPTDSTPRYADGDEAWNVAGAYAQGLRANGDRAVRLLHLAMAQLRRWGDAYGAHEPPWLPPAGYVRLAEDVDEVLTPNV